VRQAKVHQASLVEPFLDLGGLMHPAFKMTTQEWQRHKLGPNPERAFRWVQVDVYLTGHWAQRAAKALEPLTNAFEQLAKSFETIAKPFQEFAEAWNRRK
jgi:hypothetical protein